MICKLKNMKPCETRELPASIQIIPNSHIGGQTESSYIYYMRRIMNNTGKSRDQNFGGGTVLKFIHGVKYTYTLIRFLIHMETFFYFTVTILMHRLLHLTPF